MCLHCSSYLIHTTVVYVSGHEVCFTYVLLVWPLQAVSATYSHYQMDLMQSPGYRL